VAASCKKDDVVDYGPIDKKIIEDYIAEKGITNAQSTASGLYYIIQKPGGDVHPTINSIITVNYQGYLTDGTAFDASATGKPLRSPLSYLIAGWQEGIPLIGVGGKITLLCPSALGYGSTAKSKIPANSVTLFNVELLKIE
jgi:FKBP-type peptidyl-prolyl cis-trans isomerase FkpA